MKCFIKLHQEVYPKQDSYIDKTKVLIIIPETETEESFLQASKDDYYSSPKDKNLDIKNILLIEDYKQILKNAENKK